MFYFLLFIFGTAVGSFLNVIAFRFKENGFLFDPRRIGGRSHCLNCKKQLKWYELIPIASFLMQAGRCRSCLQRLSWQYPLVEFLSGFIFFSVAYYFLDYNRLSYWNSLAASSWGFYLTVLLWIFIFLTLLLLSVIDFREYLVPDELVYILALGGVIWLAVSFFSGYFGDTSGSFLGSYASIFDLRDNIFINRLAGMLAGAAAIALIFILSRGRAIGFGDVKLLAALGLVFGWPDIVIILFFSFVLGAIASLILMIRRLKGFKDFVPFAPFIALASFLIFYFGEEILNFYFKIFPLL